MESDRYSPAVSHGDQIEITRPHSRWRPRRCPTTGPLRRHRHPRRRHRRAPPPPIEPGNTDTRDRMTYQEQENGSITALLRTDAFMSSTALRTARLDPSQVSRLGEDARGRRSRGCRRPRPLLDLGSRTVRAV